jgi:uncharacterized membrane protein (UPF0127 family)
MTRNARRSLVLAAVMLGVGLGATACSAREPGSPTSSVDINKPHDTSPSFATEPLSIETASGTLRFKVEIADTESERQHGLMYRTAMPQGHGMLFIFEDAAPRSFWMHNTYMPLDIIYIGADGRIVSIVNGAQPFDDTPLPSRYPANGVLELYSGEAARLGIKAGDRVRHRMYGQ